MRGIAATLEASANVGSHDETAMRERGFGWSYAADFLEKFASEQRRQNPPHARDATIEECAREVESLRWPPEALDDDRAALNGAFSTAAQCVRLLKQRCAEPLPAKGIPARGGPVGSTEVDSAQNPYGGLPANSATHASSKDEP